MYYPSHLCFRSLSFVSVELRLGVIFAYLFILNVATGESSRVVALSYRRYCYIYRRAFYIYMYVYTPSNIMCMRLRSLIRVKILTV